MTLDRRAALMGLATLVWPASSSTAAEVQDLLELRARRGRVHLVAESSVATEIFGFDGVTPGPLLRAQQGREFKARIFNELSLPIAVHWHGVRTANAMDGSSLTQEPIAPGSSFEYVFTPPDAGTFWYHSLVGDAELRGRGLYGMLIVEERDQPLDAVDIPLVIGDFSLDPADQIDSSVFGRMSSAEGEGLIGNHLTVNGAWQPVMECPAGRKLRARVLNATNARILNLAISGSDQEIIAYDGQPCDGQRLSRQELMLAPGQRIDLLFPQGTSPIVIAAVIEGKKVDLATVATKRNAENGSDRRGRLPPNSVADYFNIGALQDVTYTIEGGRGGGLKSAKVAGLQLPIEELNKRGLAWAVNGSAGLAPEPLFSVGAGVSMALTVDNVTRFTHALHIHGHAAWLVERGGRRLATPIWHDTFTVDPLEPVKLLFIADNPGRWLIASSIAEHFEAGCQAWFEVKG